MLQARVAIPSLAYIGIGIGIGIGISIQGLRLRLPRGEGRADLVLSVGREYTVYDLWSTVNYLRSNFYGLRSVWSMVIVMVCGKVGRSVARLSEMKVNQDMWRN